MNPHDIDGPESPTRRRTLHGLTALGVAGAAPGLALAQQFPTAKVNTTKLAVTDSEVTVG